ncbi:MAG: ATP-binding protein [Bacteroidota bacterium]
MKDKDNMEIDYEHFGCPFILSSEAVYSKIRNLNYRYIADDTLFPTEITQYEPFVIREALHNCIAHQEYLLSGKINVVEKPGELIFSNLGSFIPGSINKVIELNAPPEHYRNEFLTKAMVNLNMIDTIGGGIKKMFQYQRNRFFPLPDYDLSNPQRVVVTIYGRILDKNYTRLLIKNTGLDLKTVMLLDKVQKHLPVTSEEAKRLKFLKLIEGRKPNYYVTSQIAKETDEKSRHIRNKAFDDEHYKKLIIAYMKKYKSANRKEIDHLLWDKLSDVLSEEQKKYKIGNLLSALRKEKIINNSGNKTRPLWILVAKNK